MPHVTVVAPTTYFGNMRKMKSTAFMKPEVSPISDLEAIAQQEAAQINGFATGYAQRRCFFLLGKEIAAQT